MKGKLLTSLLVALLCFAPLTVTAQEAKPDADQAKFQAFQKAQQQHWRDTMGLRQQVMLKQQEMATLMLDPKTKEDQVLKKHQELQDARGKLEREQLTFRYRIRQQYPEVAESYDMMGYGMGMGPGMMGGGMGMMCPGGTGPGMMGGSMMGPGMMGQGGMMGGGMGMGPGMMGGRGMMMGPGMMGGPGAAPDQRQ